MQHTAMAGIGEGIDQLHLKKLSALVISIFSSVNFYSVCTKKLVHSLCIPSCHSETENEKFKKLEIK